MLYKILRVCEWLNQKRLGIHFLFLSKNDINSVLKIPVANFCRLITPQTYPGHGRCVASVHFNCVWFVDPIFPESKSKVLLKLCIKLLNFNLKLPSVLLKQLAWPSPSTRPRVLNTSMRLCRNECKKSKYWSVR